MIAGVRFFLGGTRMTGIPSRACSLKWKLRQATTCKSSHRGALLPEVQLFVDLRMYPLFRLELFTRLPAFRRIFSSSPVDETANSASMFLRSVRLVPKYVVLELSALIAGVWYEIHKPCSSAVQPRGDWRAYPHLAGKAMFKQRLALKL